MALQYTSGSKYYYAPTPISAPGWLPSGWHTITGWFRMASGYSGNQAIFGLGNGSTVFDGASSFSANIVAQERNSVGGSGSKTIAANPTDGAWHFVAKGLSSTNIYGGMDGAPVDTVSASNINGQSQGTFDRLFVGGGGNVGFLNGTSTALHVAEVAVWGDHLQPAEIQALYSGVSPLRLGVAPTLLLAYYPLRNNLRDYGPSRVTLKASTTAMSPVFVDHPPVDAPPARRPYLLKAAAAGGGGSTLPISAPLTASSAESATLGRSRAISAAQTAATAEGAALGRSRPIAAAIAATTDQSASFNGNRAITAPLAASSSEAAALTRSRALASAETASTSLSAGLSRTRPLASAETAAATLAATLTGDHVISAPMWASSGTGPQTKLHYAAGSNFDQTSGDYLLQPQGFNLADVSSLSLLNLLPDGVLGLVYVGMTNGADAAFQSFVTPFLGNPKVYGFYLADEPIDVSQGGSVTAANLKAESDWIHANFPGAKTFIVLENNGTPEAPNYSYTPANTGIDLFGLDPYPVRPQFSGGIDLSVINAGVSAAVSAGIPVSQIVPVYQAFGGGGYSSWTVPTPDQAQKILETWSSLVPAPAFDVVYAWGEQSGDTALVDLPEQQAIFAAHNAVKQTTVSRSRALAASLTASTAQTADQHALGSFGANQTASSDQAAALGRTRPIAAAETASATQSATLHGDLALAAGLAASSGQTATTGRSRAIAASETAASAQQADLNALHPGLNSQQTAVGTQNVSLARKRGLSSGQAASSVQSAGLSGIHVVSAPQVAATAQAASLTRIRPLAASQSAASAFQVTLTGGHVFSAHHAASSAQAAILVRRMANTRPRPGRLLVVPADRRTLTVPADRRIAAG